MKKIYFNSLFLIFISLSSLSVQADERCDVKFSQNNVCANVDWVYGPFLDQYTSAKIIHSENNNVVTLKVIPWMVMANHEHGSRPVVLTKTSDREYLVEKAFFMGGMEGSWFFRIQLLDTNKKVLEEARYPIMFTE